MGRTIEKSVSVIVPALNEEDSIGSLVYRIFELHPDAEVIVVDDGSKDNTKSVAESAGAYVVSHPYNMGNGAAIKTGMRVAEGDIFVTMDADGQHRPEDIEMLLNKMDSFDMVVGARTFSSQANVKRAFGNLVYNYFASYITKFKVKDLTSGFRGVRRSVALEALPLFPNTYSYPTTLTLATLRIGYSVYYTPIEAKKRASGSSGVRIVQDGVRFLMIIIKICTLFSPLRVFIPVSGIFALLGMINYLYTFFYSGRFTNMSAVFFLSAIIVFMMGSISEQICQMRYDK